MTIIIKYKITTKESQDFLLEYSSNQIKSNYIYYILAAMRLD